MHRFVEVSHVVEAGMRTYPGLPEPVVEVLFDHDSSSELYEGKAEFLISSLHLCGNTGTYVDSPRHRYRDGCDLAGLPLESVAHVPAIVVDASSSPSRRIGPEAFRGLSLRDRAVLIRTGWSHHWGSPEYLGPNPFVSAEACDLLIEEGARFVGIDSLNIDDVDDKARPVHTKLLGRGIPICEHLANLERAPESGAFLHAVPIAWKGGATFPVRAYLIADA